MAYRLDILGLSREMKDMVIMGQISATQDISPSTKSTKRKEQKAREISRTQYFFHGSAICVNMFMFLHCISCNKLNSLKTWLRQNGLSPVVLKSGGRRNLKNCLTPEDVQNAVKFIGNYAEEFAVFLPGRVPGFSRADIRLLPSSSTKASIHSLYQASMEEQDSRAMALSTFKNVWRQYTPLIVTAKPMTDLCWTCQQNTQRLFMKANQTEEEKLEQLQHHQQHLDEVLVERTKYREETAAAKESIAGEGGDLGRHPPNSRQGKMHYSFDYAQQVHYPANPQQPGPTYFLSTRKCGIFGVNCEGIPKQVNFLIDEGMALSKGSIAVISYLHFFFNNFGLGEKEVSLHCDNCSGQNKNKFMLWYLSWRCLHYLHDDITLNFMVAGHTKFAPDFCFGLLKKKYQASQVSTLEDIANVVRQSSTKGINVPVIVGDESGNRQVPTYQWQDFLSPHFRPVPDIKSYHHFRFSSREPGVVYCRRFADTEEKRFVLLKPGANPPRLLPPSLPPPGLSHERQLYLYQKIRPFCRPDARDVTCPEPEQEGLR
nr:uncharacterized protein LOC129266415 [Lytechinus pictus]